MSDDEVLPLGNDLSRHMISEGFIDFETYNQYMPHGSSRFSKADSSSSALTSNNLDCKTIKNTYVSPHDHSKLMNLLNSNLLLPEDFELMEFLISRTATSNCQASYLWVCGGTVIVSTISLALYLSKRISIHLPATLVSTISFLSLRHCYNYLSGISESRSFVSAIGSLQSLCLNVNRLLRLLKETEILSTGQVTTHNVGAALYIPVKTLSEQETLPPWKTLPHLRKCLSNTLLDMIDLLKSTCAEARKVVPNWLYIEGYTLSNESSLPNLTPETLCRTNDYISLKDLQLLNVSYLILQSELLRWIGFCICPSAWNRSDSNYNYSRTKILKLFYSVQSKLSAISFKLKMHYDIQNIFMEDEQLINQRLKSSNMKEINNVQLELHNLYLLILSMLIHLKSLEDQLESNSNSVASTSLSNLRQTMNQQLKKVRDDLKTAVNMFDSVCLHSFPNQKTGLNQSEKLDKEHFDNSISKSQRNPSEESTSQSDCHINSLDEVFLAISDFVPNEQDKQRDNWDGENKPPIPKTLLAELSTTLKPIKENFKEREKAALERAGLEDINHESDGSSVVTDENLEINSSDKPLPKFRKKRRASKLKRTNYEPLDSKNEDSESDSKEGSVNTHTKMNVVQNTSIPKDGPSTSFPVLNDKSIANMIAMKSQTWGLTEEEYYSDD